VGFEPEGALYASDFEGVEFYDKITEQAPDFLNENGYLMFELGIGQAQQVKSFMEKAGFKNICIEKDLAQIERIIWGRK
jgi:release factor glutamine methyltransferase